MASEVANPILLITGAMAAGKSSVAVALARRMPKSVHLRGDVFRRMVVNGRVEMGVEPNAEALSQLLLRYRAAARTAQLYSRAGFNVVVQDVVLGPLLGDVVAMYRGYPLHVVVLCPRAEVIAEREARRAKTGYGAVTVAQLQDALADTPRLGLWLDNSDQTVTQTVDAISAGLDQAAIRPAQ